MNITVESPTKDAPLSVFNSRSRPDLLPGGTGNAAVDFYSPINEMLPEIMNFNVNVKYKDMRGQRTARDIPLTYHSLTDYWTRSGS